MVDGNLMANNSSTRATEASFRRRYDAVCFYGPSLAGATTNRFEIHYLRMLDGELTAIQQQHEGDSF